ncbi:MAG: hypothetical protein VKJ02_17770 [Snowella sp.]|nr:hypothetical protein [Snowella sp.]
MKQTIYETDWLGSRPVFYNLKTRQVSYNINDVIDFKNLEFDEEGFNHFLDCGYSILGVTPIKNVKILRYSSQLTVQDDGSFLIEHLPDPVEDWLDKVSDEGEVLERLKAAVEAWENSVDGEIIIPTSGGYDSRLLNLLIHDKSRIRSFTYGVSTNQAQSVEVVHAQLIAQTLGTKWERISLGNFHRYFDEWDQEFGISTHAHGMYHIEFYQQIRTKVQGNNPFLSGIIGDLLSGKVTIPEIKNLADIRYLSYSHGLKATSRYSRFKNTSSALLENYYQNNQEKLNSSVFRMIEMIRFKIILLSYLCTIPRSFGFKPWSPFLVPDIALSMLTLPPERKANRLWQQEFFQKYGLDLESSNVPKTYLNNLNVQAWKQVPLQPLNTALLADYIEPDYVNQINRQLQQPSLFRRMLLELENVPKVSGLLYRSGANSPHYQAYGAYLTLKPIETALLKKLHA